ncbi:unnamed protein product [Malus baccata var. baccata]
MRKLFEIDFLAVVDGAVKDGAAKIRATEVEVSAEQTVECKPQGKIGMARSRDVRLAQF